MTSGKKIGYPIHWRLIATCWRQCKEAAMHEGPVVVGVDGSPESLQALRKAAELAENERAGGGLDLVVVHVRHSPWLVSPQGAPAIKEALDTVEDDVRRQIESVLGGRWLTWRFVLRSG